MADNYAAINVTVDGLGGDTKVVEDEKLINNEPRCDGKYEEIPPWRQGNESLRTSYRLN